MKHAEKKRRRHHDHQKPELPSAVEAEKGALGCLMIEPKLLTDCWQAFGFKPVWYDLRNATVYNAMVEKSKNGGFDLITLTEYFKGSKSVNLDYLCDLERNVTSATNLPLYIETVLDAYRMRSLVQTCEGIISRIHQGEGDMDDFWFATRSDLAELINIDSQSSEQVWSVRQLNDFDADRDPNAVIGLRDGRTTRYLCRGYGAWLIGPSGVGKSSLIHQAAFCWALGRPFLGISPVRRLRVLIIQAENDEGDAAEMTQGILRSLGITEMDDELAILDQNIRTVTERRTVGDSFCSWLEKQIIRHQADIVFVDPFLSFAGIDVSRLDQCSKFLRQTLNPVLVATGAILFASHHTGKPRFEKGTRNPTAIDYAYAGIGSSELVNWARAVMVLLQLGDGQHYELKLAKRGPRAGATHPSGEFTQSIFMQHARDRIYWEQVEAPEEPAEPEEQKRKGGKPSKIEEIAASNLHGFISGCLPAGEGLNAIAKRMASWFAINKKDYSESTLKRVMPLLVENGKLIKTHDLVYKKGPNA